MLQDFLNKFILIYINNILIFIIGSLQKYYKYINKMLYHLYDVSLQLDIDKYEFKI